VHGSSATGRFSLVVRGLKDSSDVLAVNHVEVPEPDNRRSTTFTGAMAINGPTDVRAGGQAAYRIVCTTNEVRSSFSRGPRYVSARFLSGSGKVSNDATYPGGARQIWWTTEGPGEIEITLALPADVNVPRYSIDAWTGGTSVCCGALSLITEIVR
jgi:hypothetical protein